MRHNYFRSMININDFPSSDAALRCSRGILLFGELCFQEEIVLSCY
jgi:hypothetical protein